MNLDQTGNTSMFFITEEAKEIVLDFSQKNWEGLLYILNIIL